MGPRGIKSTFIGYASNSKVYKLLDLDSNINVESRNMKFFENLNTMIKDYQIFTKKVFREEGTSKVVEK